MRNLFKKFNQYTLIVIAVTPFLVAAQCSLLEEGIVSLTIGKLSKVSMSAAENQLIIEEATIGISKIEFKQLHALEGEDDIDFEADYACDLLDETCDPDLAATEIPAGCYVKIEAELNPTDKITHDACPDESNSVLVSGTAPNNMPFVFCYAQSEDFKAEDGDGFSIEAGYLNDVLLLFNLEGWFEGVPWDEVEDPDGNGMLEINSEQNRDIRDIIETNIESNSVLGRDQDGDRIIDTETCIESVDGEDSV